MRMAILEDDLQSQQQLLSLLEQWAVETATPLAPAPVCYASGEAFLADFAPGRFDVIFLDIYLEGLNGIEVAGRIRQCDAQCRLVFTSYSPDFAVESYEVDASYYLVKPFDGAKLAKALERCSASLLEQRQSIALPDGKRLFLHPIAYTEFLHRRVCVHNQDGSTLEIAMTQREFSALLLRYPYFCDCMKGMLVNLEAVEQLLPDRFLLVTGDYVPISRLKYRQVSETFLNYHFHKLRSEF